MAVSCVDPSFCVSCVGPLPKGMYFECITTRVPVLVASHVWDSCTCHVWTVTLRVTLGGVPLFNAQYFLFFGEFLFVFLRHLS